MVDYGGFGQTPNRNSKIQQLVNKGMPRAQAEAQVAAEENAQGGFQGNGDSFPARNVPSPFSQGMGSGNSMLKPPPSSGLAPSPQGAGQQMQATASQPNFNDLMLRRMQQSADSNYGVPPGIARPPEKSRMDQILESLGQKYSFDRGAQDTSGLDSAFQSRMDALNGLRDTANSNFQQSDKNLNDMHEAFKNQILGQASGIQAQGDQYNGQIAGAFDKSIADAEARKASDAATKTEMLQRLGIAPAANAPDLAAQASNEGIAGSEAAKTARLAENATNTNTNLSRNNSSAISVGNAGVERRSNLNRQLQDMLGQINMKGADFQNQYATDKNTMLNQADDKAYQRFLQDRQFEMGIFNSINSSEAAAQKAAAKTGTPQLQGIQGLSANSTPQVRQAAAQVAQKINIKMNPEQAIKSMINDYGISNEDAYNYVTAYANLGSTNKFDDPNANGY